MTNVPAVMQSSMRSLLENVPEQYSMDVVQAFGGLFDELGGGGAYSQISFKSNRFTLKSGGNSETLPSSTIHAIIVGAAPRRHNIYFKGAYDPNAVDEDKIPTAVWWEGDPYPDTVPMEVRKQAEDRKKALARGEKLPGTYPYQMAWRTVLWLLRQDDQGRMDLNEDDLYTANIGSMSLFSATPVTNDSFSLSAYVSMLRQKKILPCQLLTKISFDLKQSVPVVRFSPTRKDSGEIGLLSPSMAQKALEIVTSDRVKMLSEVKLIGYGEAQRGIEQEVPVDAAPPVVNTTRPATLADHIPPTQESVYAEPVYAEAPKANIPNVSEIVAQAKRAAASSQKTLDAVSEVIPDVVPPAVEEPKPATSSSLQDALQGLMADL